jgi:hypothetical protein
MDLQHKSCVGKLGNHDPKRRTSHSCLKKCHGGSTASVEPP